MADNVTLNAGVGGATLATDDVSGTHYQVVKLDVGGDGAAAPVSNTNPVPVSDAGGSLTVDVGTALPAGTNAIGKLAANSGVDIGDVDVTSVPADPFGANADAASAIGSISAKLRFIAATGIPVTGTVTVGSHAVTNAGTFAVQATVAAAATNIAKAEDVASADADVGVPAMAVRKATPANTSGTDGDYEFLQISAGRLWASATIDAALPAGTNNIGDVDVLTLPGAAHDAAVSGNPVRVAGRARTSDYTSVASDDTADILTTLNGKIVTQPFAIPELSWSYAAASGGIVNTTGVTAKAAAASGIRNYVTRAQVINGHATVSTDVQIRDGASGTVLWRGFAQAAGGGAACDFDPPLKGTAATLIEVACGTTGTATYFNLQGYTGP